MSWTDLIHSIFNSPAQFVMLIILLIFVIAFAKYTGLRISKQRGIYFKDKKQPPPPLQPNDCKEHHNNLKCELDRSCTTLESTSVKVDTLIAMVETIDERIKQMSTDMLRVSFYSNMQIPERIVVGLRYIKEGGNSYTRNQIAALIRENRATYDTIIQAVPELKNVIDYNQFDGRTAPRGDTNAVPKTV